MIPPKLFIKARQEQRLRSGHLWVFSNEVEKLEGAAAPGGLVDLYSSGGFLGRGFYNPHSLIAARILTRRAEPIDAGFFRKRLRRARAARETFYPGVSSYRLAFGESDGFPGLVIDRFEDGCVLQSYALGMDLLLPVLQQALAEELQPAWMFLKNDSSLRALEGLNEEARLLSGELHPPVLIKQKLGADELRFWADPMEGQKTGFFFDQRENREALAALAPGKRVLDAYSYVGGFGVYAGKAGAKEVVSVDSSAPACALIRKNFQENGVNGAVAQEDVEAALERFQKEKKKFDIIVLDPPALAKSKKNLFGALRKYAKLNAAALALIEPGGLLMSCSCSHHVGRREFIQMLAEASADAGREIRIVEMRGQAKDHPLHPAMPETEYLKCALIHVS